jgi:hypothetical protein
MLRFTNIESAQERRAFFEQIADYARVFTTRLAAVKPDAPGAWRDIVGEAEEHSRLSCQLFRYLRVQAEDEEISDNVAMKIAAFGTRILEAIAKESGTADGLHRIERAVKKLRGECSDWSEMIRVARTLDFQAHARDHHLWASLYRNTVPAVEWVMDEPSEGQCSTPLPNLTISQLNASKQLQQFLGWHRGGQTIAGIWMRPIPLLVGPTGAGKTTVVRHFCISEGLPYLHLDSSSWLIVGASGRPWTLHEIRNFVNRHEEGVLFIDELDKFSAKHDGWDRHLVQELMALLDYRVPESAGWSRDDRTRLAERFLIIGAGTWQADHRQHSKKLGFGAESEERFTLDMGKQDAIPEELLRRFNSNVIRIDPPTKGELIQRVIQVHAELRLPPPSRQQLETLGSQAIESGENTRWLEGYVTRILSTQPRLLERAA